MAEFALLLPMLLVIIFGIAEFGFMLSDQITVTNAARDGARTGALKGNTSSQAVSEAQSSASGTINCPVQTPTTSYSSTQVTVTVQCSYSPATPLAPIIKLMGGSFNGSITISASATMRLEQ